jgi:hypothetical protein
MGIGNLFDSIDSILLGSISSAKTTRQRKGETMTNGKDNNDGHPNLPEMRNEFRAAITRLAEATVPTQQASACVDTLVEHVGRLGIDVNIEYGQRAFQRASEAGHLVEECMDWWDEVVNDICYPVACCHVVTGTLPGGYVSHTVAAISVYDRDGKPVAHDAVEWADHSSAETDEECHSGFSWAIRHKAADLGARSLFRFIDGVLCSSLFIDQDPEQGPGWFHERSYGKREKAECLGNELTDDSGQTSEAQPTGGGVGTAGPAGGDFFAKLKRMRDAKAAERHPSAVDPTTDMPGSGTTPEGSV